MLVLVAAIAAAVSLATVLVAVWRVRNDGGPQPRPPARHDDWSTDPPSYPYTHRPPS